MRLWKERLQIYLNVNCLGWIHSTNKREELYQFIHAPSICSITFYIKLKITRITLKSCDSSQRYINNLNKLSTIYKQTVYYRLLVLNMTDMKFILLSSFFINKMRNWDESTITYSFTKYLFILKFLSCEGGNWDLNSQPCACQTSMCATEINPWPIYLFWVRYNSVFFSVLVFCL